MHANKSRSKVNKSRSKVNNEDDDKILASICILPQDTILEIIIFNCALKPVYLETSTYVVNNELSVTDVAIMTYS